jgi:hypothetical protein
MNMKKVFKNFLWQKENEPQNLLTYLFLIVNLSYGINFVFFGHTSAVKASIISNAFFPGWIWGVACLLLVIVTLWGIAFRNRIVGGSVGFPGVMVWGYGLALSILSTQWLAAFAVYLPQVLFWVWWHIGVMRFYEKEKILKRRNKKKTF